MLTYCISCKKDTECISCEIAKTKNNKLLFRSVCKDCKKNKSRFYKGSRDPFNCFQVVPLIFTVNYYHYYQKGV